MCVVIRDIEIGNTVAAPDTCLIGSDGKGNFSGIIGKNLCTYADIGTCYQSCKFLLDDLVCVILSYIKLELIVHVS